MQKYIIDSFKVRSEIINSTLQLDKIYNRNDITGDYVAEAIPDGNITESIKGINDFLCTNYTIINSVKRCVKIVNGYVSDDNTIFKLNDQLDTTNIIGASSNVATIIGITIFRNKCILILNTIGDDKVDLINAVKYIEPIKSIKANKNNSNNSNNDIFESLVSKIESGIEPIRLTKTMKSRKKQTPEEFLIAFFTEWNIKTNDPAKDTIFVESGEIQTICGKRRSLGDIYMILKYYYSSITLKEVIKLLYVTLPTKITGGFKSCKCSQILKRVWYFQEGTNNEIRQPTVSDEYGNNIEYYISNIES